MRKTEEFYQEEATGLLTSFLAGIARLNTESSEREESGMEGSKFSDMIAHVLEYINAHYNEPIKVKSLRTCAISARLISGDFFFVYEYRPAGVYQSGADQDGL